MAKIHLLSGPAVGDALQDAAVRQIFRYRLNPPTVGLLVAIALLFFIGAGLVFFGPGLGGGYSAAFFVSLFLGVSFFSMAGYWSRFKDDHFIAISDEYLFVGKEEKAWQIHWSLITRETLDFEAMSMSRFRGKLMLDAAGQPVEIPLFTPFVFVEDIEGLMLEVLRRLDEEPERLPGAESPDASDPDHD
jgi:hypothetical protein